MTSRRTCFEVKQPLLPRFQSALVLANILHGEDTRKGSNVPYISHVLQVAGIVLEYGGNEDEAIGGLLHDTVEDAKTGCAHYVRETIEEAFGRQVLGIVDGCTDTPAEYEGGGNKPDWRLRKEKYIEHIANETDTGVCLVSAADKLANARSILKDVRESGDRVFSTFKGGKAGTFWYYRALIDSFRESGTCPALVDELNRTISEAERLAYSDSR